MPDADENPVLYLRVRFAETDQMGIAHHSAYPVWMEAGRVQWLRAHGLDYRTMEEGGLSLSVSAMEVRYRQAARFDDLIAVTTTLVLVRSRLLRLEYRLERDHDGTLLATGATVHVPTDRRGRAVRLPEVWLTPLTALVEPAA
ncbi:MAG: thioesterase family protein [Deinococcales bacterium]